MKEEKEDGLTIDDYLYRYQAEVYYRYTSMLETTQLSQYTEHGWNVFFTYSYGDLLLFFSLILFALTVFIPEKQIGIYPILHSCKNGRR